MEKLLIKRIKRSLVDVVVIAIDIYHDTVQFRIARGAESEKNATGILSIWAGYWGKLLYQGQIIRNASFWDNREVFPVFNEGEDRTLMLLYYKQGKALVEQAMLSAGSSPTQGQPTKKKREVPRMNARVVEIDWEVGIVRFEDLSGIIRTGSLFTWVGSLGREPVVDEVIATGVRVRKDTYEPCENVAKRLFFQDMGVSILKSLGKDVALPIAKFPRLLRMECSLCRFWRKENDPTIKNSLYQFRVVGWCDQAPNLRIQVIERGDRFLTDNPKGCGHFRYQDEEVQKRNDDREDLLCLPFMGPKLLEYLERHCGQITSTEALREKADIVRVALKQRGWKQKKIERFLLVI